MIRRALKVRLFGTAAAGALGVLACASHVGAQTQPTPPEHYTLDPRGVDLVTGKFVYRATDVVIGQPDNGGLVHARVWANGGWRDILSGTIAVSGSTYTVSLGAVSEVFTKSGSTFTPVSNRGATLVQTTAALLTFTTANGTVATYSTTYSGSTSPYQANGAALMSVKRPNGETLALHWDGYSYCRLWDLDPMTGEPGQCLDWANAVRLDAVSNNRGYQINFEYAADDIPIGSFPEEWLQRTGAIGINRAIEYCDPYSHCSGTRTWPRVDYSRGPFGGDITSVTDQSGRTTTYTYDPTYGGLSGVRLPGSTSDDVSVDYGAAGRVSSVTDPSGAWTYAYVDSGTTRTTTATGPLSQQLVVVSNQAIGRATSVTNALNDTTSYAYDSQRRLQRVTQPEGDYAEATYDARGNVTLMTYVPKSGSGQSSVTTGATYPSTCSNPVTCNLPTSTTDPLGNVTDYTWDSTHGGPLTITAPAPTTGADRPQTRYTYAPQTAYYKNSVGSVVASATSVNLPTVVSACAAGTSCIGGTDEVRTTITYGSTGVGNNLLPTSISQGSGASPAMAVTGLTYTADSDLETVDGPLSGTADTTRFRYDNARQRVGVIGPDPDGGGSGLNRAQRMTYSLRGQVIETETGTTVGQSDGAWAAFNPIVSIEADYDSYGRLSMVEQPSGGAAPVTQRQLSYDAAGRVLCDTVRMKMDASVPTDACTAETPSGTYGPDRITRMTYDNAGRPLSITTAYGQPEAITESVTYTDNGRIASLTDGEGNVSVPEYDGFDRMTKLRYPDPAGGGASTTDYESYTFDAAGRVLTSRNRAAATTTVTWDGLGRITNIDAPSGTMDIAATYDNLGRVLTATANSQTLTQVWDPLSRLTSETGPLGTMGYQYDAASRMTRITWPDSFYVTYDHDLYGAVTAIRENGASSGAGVLATYAYNDLGQMTGTTRASGAGASTAFGYDAFTRLNSVAHNASGTADDVTLTFSYNPDAQIVGRTVSNAAYVYAPVTGTTAYGVNGLNEVISIAGGSVTYDGNQNIAAVPGSTYGYDAANRLISANAGAGAAAFTFDPAERLYQASLGGVSTRFQYVGQQLAAEYDGMGTLLRRYVPGLGLDDVVASYEGAGTSNRSWLLTDERGSVIALSNGSGVVSTIDRYDEYGVPASGNSGRFQYTGQMWLEEAGLYHYRARAYAPQIGRFTQPDPISYAAGTNLYAYVRADPINLTDPLGLVPGGNDCVPDPDFPSDACLPGIDVTGQPCPESFYGYCISNPTGGPGWSIVETRYGPGGGGRGTQERRDRDPVDRCTSVPEGLPSGENFQAACRAHDNCYATRGASREACDVNFYHDLRDACDLPDTAVTCRAAALTYYLGIRAVGGPAFWYEQRQAEDRDRRRRQLW